MKYRRSILATAAGLALAVGATAVPALGAGSATAPPARAVATQADAPLTQEVSGTWESRNGRSSGTVTGTMTIEGFTNDGTTLFADTAYDLVFEGKRGRDTVQTNVDVPVRSVSVEPAAPSATSGQAPVPEGCGILDLDLGPVTLDLLGLVIVLQPVVLDIVAVPGAGNLLGNLLCAVAGLLDGTGIIAGLLNSLTALLNDILAALEGLAAQQTA